MADESVQILIEADDKASSKFENVSEAMERNVKQIKDVGGKAKASTELVGTLANSLGGTALGSFAGQLAQVTERVSAFSEVAKEGGAGAAAFKVGLAGVVGVLGFEVGQALGNVIFQTERWKEELAKATDEAKRLNAALSATKDFRFSLEMEEASLLGDPAAQREQLKGMLSEVDEAIEQTKARIASVPEEWNWAMNMLARAGGGGAAVDDIAQQNREKELLVQQLEQLRGQRTELDRMLSDRKANNDALREQIALQEKTTSYIDDLRRQVEYLEASRDRQIEMDAAASGVAEERRAEVEFLLRMRDAAQERLELEKQIQQQAEAAAAQRKAELAAELASKQNVAQSHLSVVQSLKQQAIELRQGAEAAKQYQLEMQGFAADEAAQLAEVMSTLDSLRNQTSASDSPLSAVQGRLLTRGQGADPLIEQGKAMLGVNEKMKASLEKATQILERIESKELFELLEYSV